MFVTSGSKAGDRSYKLLALMRLYISSSTRESPLQPVNYNVNRTADVFTGQFQRNLQPPFSGVMYAGESPVGCPISKSVDEYRQFNSTIQQRQLIFPALIGFEKRTNSVCNN